MSFSSDIKDKVSTIENECEYCNFAELSALLRYTAKIKDGSIILSTENESVAKCIKKLIRVCFSKTVDYTYGGDRSRLYELCVSDDELFEKLCGLLFHSNTELKTKENECCINAYIRGAFLGGGSISDPHKSYHLEFDARYEAEADRLLEFLKKAGVLSKITSRKNLYVVYIKEYSAIADVLSIIGAAGAAFDIYNISIEKDVRNNINRQMNCENANMDKIADAYKKHLSAIEKIKKTIGLDKLPDTLFEMATVRVLYPEDSLKQLGERLQVPIGKSGVNHRLNRIVEIADNL